MNKAKLKSYAPQARKDFIAAVTARANLLGLSTKVGKLEVVPSQTQGDVTVIAGQAWPAKVDGQRKQLIARIQKDGFDYTMEAVAYTWFNRFAALRFMELHDYLGHGHRALSSTSGGLPDILTHATDVSNAASATALPGLNATKVTELKIAGNRDAELYRMLLVAQCNALSRAMPFLFERIDDDSELLLPDNLLRSDSVIAKLVEEIPEEDWAEVEIIGWLYQFYISDKKDQVIGKVVKSEDIPAATQLFTPNWIVQYLVQNSVGRLWLMANPQSDLAKEWPYYITPAEQTPEVQAQIDALIQTRVSEDGDSLNPESITVLDPACGSGHILVVAYDVLKAIYLERGYQARVIPRLILEKNLYGLDIDDRAAQMAGFALLMKARADDRRLFNATDDAGNLQPPKLNVLSLQESKGLSVDELATHLTPFKVQRATITALVEAFENAKTFGSLIQIPYELKTQLALLPEILTLVQKEGDMYARASAKDLFPLVMQAQLLAMQFDAVVANPPYMGSGGMNSVLKRFAAEYFPDAKSDMFACFIERSYTQAKATGFGALVTMLSWMFISSFQKMRESLLREKLITTMTQIGYNSFPSMNSKIAQATVFTLLNSYIKGFTGVYSDLNGAPQAADKEEVFLSQTSSDRYQVIGDNFSKFPGSAIAFWAPNSVMDIFGNTPKLGETYSARSGVMTGDDEYFLKYWYEVDFRSIGFNCTNETETLSSQKFFPMNKEEGFKKWSGRYSTVFRYLDHGSEYAARDDINYRLRDKGLYFKEGISWGDVTSGPLSFRYQKSGLIFAARAPTIFSNDHMLLAFLNCKVTNYFCGLINPTLSFNLVDLYQLPLLTERFSSLKSQIENSVDILIRLSESDWAGCERSWDFQSFALLTQPTGLSLSLERSYSAWNATNRETISMMKRLEEEINSHFAEVYGLTETLTSEVPIDQITLNVNPAYRYGSKFTNEEKSLRFRENSVEDLISYAIGCMMGRYSLDEPGLIYAHSGNIEFEPGRYKTFPADADGIVPITDELWFEDDAASRVREFLLAALGQDTLEENMAWLAESLGTKASETPDETIRRYIADKFFKDHLQTYKKRPIYWLFSSGKQGAFQALVYLHRYHEGTLSRLRAEYVVPLTGKIQSRIEMLQRDTDAASSTSVRNKLAKEVEKLKKKHSELLAYDEQLRHYADMRITLDVDDGVKVNYGKFGELLDSVKVVTGGAGDE